jgi:hypothetical protein
MTHESVVTLLEDVAKSLGDSVTFGYGALEDFNTLKNKVFPYVWLYPLKGEFVSGESKLTSSIEFEIEINILHEDSTTGADFETAQAWDKGFKIMEGFVHKLDEFILDPETNEGITSDLVSLDRVRFEAGRKATGDVLTGWKLTFTMTVPTEFEYCSLYE